MVTGLLTPAHIAIVLVIMLLLFGAQRLPETGRGLGRAMREFKEGITGRDEPSAAIRAPALTDGDQPETTRVDHDGSGHSASATGDNGVVA